MHRDHDGRKLLLERWPAKGAPGTQKGGREKGERAALTWAWKETFLCKKCVAFSREPWHPGRATRRKIGFTDD